MRVALSPDFFLFLEKVPPECRERGGRVGREGEEEKGSFSLQGEGWRGDDHFILGKSLKSTWKEKEGSADSGKKKITIL